MNILALDTSSTSGSIAIYKNDKFVYLGYLDIKVTHSERLLPQIRKGLEFAELALSEIDLIGFTNGPGSFTGLRIGLSAVKGFSFGKEIPIYPVNTLEALAFNLFGNKLPILPMIDAKMNEVYAALYTPAMKVLIEPQNSKPADFLKKIKKQAIIVGDGSARFSYEISNSRINFKIAQPHQNFVLASSIISIVLHRKIIPQYDFQKISELEPDYLRLSQAEINKQSREKN